MSRLFQAYISRTENWKSTSEGEIYDYKIVANTY